MPRDYETPEYLRKLPPAERAAIEVELLMTEPEPEVAREVLRQLDQALYPWVPAAEWVDAWDGLPARLWMLREEEELDDTVVIRLREVWAISDTCVSVTDDDEAFCIDFTRVSFKECHGDGAWVRPCWTPNIPDRFRKRRAPEAP